ncbi:leucyl aminopeptidase [Candidatus Micrarchaeota archaeon]|nr:leucyl aminopeptidase [Candidatus Micrarchaeota archaeon]
MKIKYYDLPGTPVAIFLMEKENAPVKCRFEGKLGETYSTENHLLVGLGDKKEFRNDSLRRAAGTAVKFANIRKEKEISIILPKWIDDDGIRAVAEGAVLANYQFLHYKSEKEKNSLEIVKVIGRKSKALETGRIYGEAQNYARDMDERPANIATPMTIAAEAKKLKKVKVTVFGKKALEKNKMNAILGVAKGSRQPPVLLKLEYNSGRKLPLYCIVGKGITFDSGGISLKPSKDMHEMKYDKTGAINVMGVFRAVSELNLPIRLIGFMPLTENIPDGNAQKPGDIVRAYNGKTIEVLNTDAEGRLVLADALSFAAEHKPEYIIDMATLTGAISISLGRHAIGLFSNDDKLAEQIEIAGNQTHERVWRLPLWKEYGEMMKSNIADLKNISEVPEAGSITAAAFLREFVGEAKWAHLDIAGVEVMKNSHPYFSSGATCIGVRLVTRTLENLAGKI